MALQFSLERGSRDLRWLTEEKRSLGGRTAIGESPHDPCGLDEKQQEATGNLITGRVPVFAGLHARIPVREAVLFRAEERGTWGKEQKIHKRHSQVVTLNVVLRGRPQRERESPGVKRQVRVVSTGEKGTLPTSLPRG